LASVDPLGQQASSNVLGKFRLIAELGRGGMSEVYLAVVAGPAGFNKLVVVKLIKGDLAEDPEFISMFLEEARLSARLSHPNVVQTNEVGEFHGRYYIAMEYLEGQPYSRVLHRLGRDRGLPLGMSLRIMSDVLSGLQYAHELVDFDGSPLSVVHRDVTPHNIFVTYDGQVKVVDFGIAKAMNSSHETRTGMLKGKVGYMAPEQAKGERVDRRADIFSVGVMLWEAATGRRMWKGMNEVQILHQLLAGDIPSPRTIRPDISQQLESIIMRSVAIDREQRPRTALDLQAELEDLMDSGHERATLREVGKMLNQTFLDERTKLKAIIEQQLAHSAALPTAAYQQMALPNVAQINPTATGELPRHSFGPPSGIPQVGHPMQNTGSASGNSVSGNTGAHAHLSYSGQMPMSQSGQRQSGQFQGGHMQSGQFPSNQFRNEPSVSMHGLPGPHSGSVPSVHGPATSGSYPGASHQSQPSVSNMTGSIARASVSRSGSQPMPTSSGAGGKLALVAAGGLAAAAILGLVLYLGLGRAPKADAAKPAGTTDVAAAPAATQDAPPTPSQTSSAAAAAPEKEISIEVRATPDSADIFLDGEKIGTGEAKKKLPSDGKEHELRVDASGYTAKVRKVAPDEEVVAWEPELARQRTGGAVGVKPPPQDETPKIERDKNGRIKRRIDSTYTP
jgi:serine/threonine-protein kinase